MPAQREPLSSWTDVQTLRRNYTGQIIRVVGIPCVVVECNYARDTMQIIPLGSTQLFDFSLNWLIQFGFEQVS